MFTAEKTGIDTTKIDTTGYVVFMVEIEAERDLLVPYGTILVIQSLLTEKIKMTQVLFVLPRFETFRREVFTSFHAEWREELSCKFAINGISLLPNDSTLVEVVVLMPAKEVQNFSMMFKAMDLYLVAFKFLEGAKWNRLRIAKDVDDVKFYGNYQSMLSMAGYGTIANIIVNKSSLENAIHTLGKKDHVQPKIIARAILQLILFFCESARFDQVEAHCSYFLEPTKERSHVSISNLPRLLTHWKKLSIIAATRLQNSCRLALLESYGLTTRENELITTLGDARKEVKLLHGTSPLDAHELESKYAVRGFEERVCCCQEVHLLEGL
ncbi:rRNA N-glycosidase [Striga asiatica]|uniref:rRNA N-glycosylase n=1 Tax=Striga asiatica TaxID=4170 RepID=A0A5A7R351_STRAF|nr:rRNA N-glycosidase [Striga asiatica]